MQMERMQIPNARGQMLAAVVYRPREKTEKLAILCPGYLDTKDYEHLSTLAQRLAEHGYTAVSFDPTGTWESEGDISEYLTSQYVEDVKSVLDHMMKEGGYTNVLLGGHSRGGQVSLLYAARDPRVSTVLGIMASFGPVAGKRRADWERAGVSVGERELPFDKSETREFAVSFEHILDRDQFDPFADIDKVEADIILLAGEQDELLSPERLKTLYEKARNPKAFVVAEGIDHEYRKRPAEIEKVNGLLLRALGLE